MKVIWIQHTELACLLNIMSTERQLYTPVAVSTSHWKYSQFNVPSLIKLQLNSFPLILLLHSSHWVQSSDIAIKAWQKLAKCLNIIPISWPHGSMTGPLHSKVLLNISLRENKEKWEIQLEPRSCISHPDTWAGHGNMDQEELRVWLSQN